jgi:CRP-like cAMP-binding protein
MMESETQDDHSAFLFDASEALKQLLEAGLRPLRLAKGDCLFDQGDHDDRLYILDDGLLEVSVLSASGRKLALNQLRPGAVFGEIAIFDPGPRTARIEALNASGVRAIRQKALLAELVRAPDLAAEMLRLAGRRMRWMSRQVEDHVFLPPAARLASKMLYLAGDSGQIAMSQAQLADYVGVTREVVSKTLASWRREGIVEVTRGKITLRDPDAIEDIRNSDFV